MPDPRLENLADVLVNYSIAVQPGELVMIRGPISAESLAVEVIRKVVQAGGRPHVRMWPDETDELVLKHGSRKQLETPNRVLIDEISTIDCFVALLGGRNNRMLTNCDPKKQAMHSRGRKPISDIFFKRSSAPRGKLRWVGTQAPTDAAAQDADMSTAEYEDFIFRAGLLDRPDPAAAWKTIGIAQQKLCDALYRVRELRFRNRDGTDLRLGVAGRKWINCCGRENFPDGEVFSGPIEDATEGVVQYRFPAVYGGREVCDIRLGFKAGRVVECSASKGEAFLISMLDQDKGGRTLGEIAIGTNYSITRYMKNVLFDEKMGGTFHAALGAAYPLTGGRNTSGLHWDMVCDLRNGGEIIADGKVISRNGRFTNPSWPRPM